MSGVVDVIGSHINLKNNTSITGNLDTSGNSHTGGNTTIDGDTTMQGNATVNGNSTLTGPANFMSTISVAGVPGLTTVKNVSGHVFTFVNGVLTILT